MIDETEPLRRARQAELNSTATVRSELEKRYGQVWTSDEMVTDFDALGFAAPYIVVRQRATGIKGSLEFQHSPRFYFNWQPDTK